MLPAALLDLPVKYRINTGQAKQIRIESDCLRDFADDVLHSEDLFPKKTCINGFLALWRKNLKTNEPLHRLTECAHG